MGRNDESVCGFEVISEKIGVEWDGEIEVNGGGELRCGDVVRNKEIVLDESSNFCYDGFEIGAVG